MSSFQHLRHGGGKSSVLAAFWLWSKLSPLYAHSNGGTELELGVDGAVRVDECSPDRLTISGHLASWVVIVGDDVHFDCEVAVRGFKISE